MNGPLLLGVAKDPLEVFSICFHTLQFMLLEKVHYGVARFNGASLHQCHAKNSVNVFLRPLYA